MLRSNGLKKLLLTGFLMTFILISFTACGELQKNTSEKAGYYASECPSPTSSGEKKKGEDVYDEKSAKDYLDKQQDSDDGAVKRAKESDSKIKKDTEKEYYALLDKYSNNDTGDDDRGLGEILLYYFYRFYLVIKMYAAPISFTSIVIGSFIAYFCRSNKQMRRFGIFGLIVGIPLLMIFIVYGVGILNGIYLN